MSVPAQSTPPAPALVPQNLGRRIHRIVCFLAGSLALLGATLAIVVHPWFALISAIGALGLILTPDRKS